MLGGRAERILPGWLENVEQMYLEPQTTVYKWMFGETTIFYIKIWNHPIETSIYKWLFGVPGSYGFFNLRGGKWKVDRTNHVDV